MVDITRATAKWATNAGNAGSDYRTGVQGKGQIWLSNSVASESNWAARIQEAISRGARSSGIQRAGAAGWEQAATSKGATNYVEGVKNPLSQQKYNKKFAPILAAIQAAKATLPPRGAPMSAENMARAQHIWNAAHGAKGTY